MKNRKYGKKRNALCKTHIKTPAAEPPKGKDRLPTINFSGAMLVSGGYVIFN